MIERWFIKKFVQSSWRFVGKLPKQYERNLFLISPHTKAKDFFKFYLPVSKLTQFQHSFYIRKRWYLKIVVSYLKKHQTYFKPSIKEIDILFNTKKLNQRQINIALKLTNKGGQLNGVDLSFYQYAKEHNLPITMVTVDHGEKMVKFHSVFHASNDFERDLSFINRYFNSHEHKNQRIINSSNELIK